MSKPDLYTGHDICEVCHNVWIPNPLPKCSIPYWADDQGNGFTDLFGRIIHDVRMDDGGQIAFEVCGGHRTFITTGDCCSSTWIENVQNVEYLRGATFTKYEVIDVEPGEDYIDDGDGEPGEDYDYYDDENFIKYYGVKLHLSKNGVVLPELIIEFRNRSNGYYGGNLEPGDIDVDAFMFLTPLIKDF